MEWENESDGNAKDKTQGDSRAKAILQV